MEKLQVMKQIRIMTYRGFKGEMQCKRPTMRKKKDEIRKKACARESA